MFSKGYSGQIKVPLRRLEFSLEQLKRQREKLTEVIESKFGSLTSAFEVTQYLRGKLFCYVDFLMANEYKDPEHEIPEVIEFLKDVLKLIVLWVDVFPRFAQNVFLKSRIIVVL